MISLFSDAFSSFFGQIWSVFWISSCLFAFLLLFLLVLTFGYLRLSLLASIGLLFHPAFAAALFLVSLMATAGMDYIPFVSPILNVLSLIFKLVSYVRFLVVPLEVLVANYQVLLVHWFPCAHVKVPVRMIGVRLHERAVRTGRSFFEDLLDCFFDLIRVAKEFRTSFYYTGMVSAVIVWITVINKLFGNKLIIAAVIFLDVYILRGCKQVCYDFIINNFNELKNDVKIICQSLTEKFIQIVNVLKYLTEKLMNLINPYVQWYNYVHKFVNVCSNVMSHEWVIVPVCVVLSILILWFCWNWLACIFNLLLDHIKQFLNLVWDIFKVFYAFLMCLANTVYSMFEIAKNYCGVIVILCVTVILTYSFWGRIVNTCNAIKRFF